MKKLLSAMLIICIVISALWCPTIAYSAGILYENLGLYFDAETGTITDCDESLEGILTIPETIDGVTVTRIGDRAFQNCEFLTEVKIPNTVTYIGTLAFSECYSLTKMTIPKSVVSCGDGTWFNGAYNLKKVIFEEGTTEILAKCMWGADSVEEVYIPSTVKKIGDYAFYWCSALKSITLPQGLEVLDGNCFDGCHALESIDIPSSVKTIGSSAFTGCGLSKVTLHEGLEVIESSAFSSCYNLTHIDFPSTLKSIGVYAFTGTSLKNILLPKSLENCNSGGWFWGINKMNSIVFEDGTTHIPAMALDNASASVVTIPDSVKTIDSGALYYGQFDMVYAPEAVLNRAIEANVPFTMTKEIDEYKYFVFENTDFEMGTDTMVGYIPFTVKYEFKESINTQNRRLLFSMPEQVTLMENTLRLNGEEVPDYKYWGNWLTIYDVPEKAEVTFSVKPHEYSDFAFYARMEFDKDYEYQMEVIGASLFKMPELSVSAPTRTSDDSVAVGGFTAPSTKVDIYLDDQYVTSTTSLKTGRYNANITLPETNQYESYDIKAVAATSTGDKKAQTSIMYDGNTPMLSSLTLEYYEHEQLKKFDMFNTDGARPNITFLPTAHLKFKATFEDNSKVENVAVVSNRGNNKKYIPAKWNEKLQCFVAEGQFDPGNAHYVPGAITVEYNTKRPEIEITDTFDPATLDPFLDDRLKDSTIEVIEDTEDTYHEKIILSDELDDLIVDEIDHVITTIDTNYSDIPITDLMSEGENIYSYLFDEGSDKYILNLDMTDPEDIIMVVHDFSNSKTVKHIISGIDYSDDLNPSKIRLGSEFLDKVGKYSGYVQDGYSIIKDDADLRKQIAASNMTWAQKQEAYKKADELQSDRVAFMAATIAIGAITAPIAGPSALVFSLLFGAVTSTSDFFWQARMGQILGADNAFYCNWIIDPSGYVYEGVTSNRLEGVTTTAYWIAPDEEGNYDEANAVVWDATEYEQMNPLITDNEGRYAWNVPEGLWQVKFEKEGYEPQYSDWLPVPPPQTEVHAGLVSYAQPTVADVMLTGDTLKVTFDKYMIPDTVKISVNGKAYTPTYRTDETDLEGNVFANTFICKLDTAVNVGNTVNVQVTGGQSYAGVDMVSYSGSAECIDLANSITINNEAKDGNNVTADFANSLNTPFVAICAAYDGDYLAEIKFVKVTEAMQTCTFEFEGEWSKFKLFAWDSLTGQNNLSAVKAINE